MDDEGVVCGSAFEVEDALDCGGVCGIGGEAVDRFGRDGDASCVAECVDGAAELVGSDHWCGQLLVRLKSAASGTMKRMPLRSSAVPVAR